MSMEKLQDTLHILITAYLSSDMDLEEYKSKVIQAVKARDTYLTNFEIKGNPYPKDILEVIKKRAEESR